MKRTGLIKSVVPFCIDHICLRIIKNGGLCLLVSMAVMGVKGGLGPDLAKKDPTPDTFLRRKDIPALP